MQARRKMHAHWFTRDQIDKPKHRDSKLPHQNLNINQIAWKLVVKYRRWVGYVSIWLQRTLVWVWVAIHHAAEGHTNHRTKEVWKAARYGVIQFYLPSFLAVCWWCCAMCGLWLWLLWANALLTMNDDALREIYAMVVQDHKKNSPWIYAFLWILNQLVQV